MPSLTEKSNYALTPVTNRKPLAQTSTTSKVNSWRVFRIILLQLRKWRAPGINPLVRKSSDKCFLFWLKRSFSLKARPKKNVCFVSLYLNLALYFGWVPQSPGTYGDSFVNPNVRWICAVYEQSRRLLLHWTHWNLHHTWFERMCTAAKKPNKISCDAFAPNRVDAVIRRN